jgi:2-iminobutanoate/2-iminopropanoate deaminase
MVKRKRKITTGVESNTGAYSSAVCVDDSVFVSGHGPLKPGTQEIVGRTIEEQTRQTLKNIQTVLAAADCDLDDCVKMTVYLADMNDFDRYNSVYKSFFMEPLPARTTVQATLWGGILVEIDAVAIKGCGKGRSQE